MYRIAEIDGKGKGAVASQAIPARTLIRAEKPIIRFPRYTRQESCSKTILPLLQSLATTIKQQFFDLSNNFPNMRPIEGIIRTNAIPLGSSSSTGGIFPSCSRFNHSCTANAAYHWNDKAGEERIYAIRDISQDEEITVSYISEELWALPARERSVTILGEFGFLCYCFRCVPLNKAAIAEEADSDRRRVRLSLLHQAIGDGELIVADPAKALAMCRESVRLFHAEGEATPRLETVYYDAFQICICHGDVPRASAFASMAAEAKRSWQGDDAPGLEEFEALARKPESHRLAFLTQRWLSRPKSVAGRSPQPTDEWLWRRTD